MRSLLAFAVLLTLAGCAGLPHLKDYDVHGPPVELSATPYFAQKVDQCGPAALATVLVADGVKVTPDDLTGQVFLPRRGGSLQMEMVAATRRHGRVPYPLRPHLRDLLAEVRAHHPVLVLQNLGLDAMPVWHYAVLIGYDPAADDLVLRSADERRQVLSTAEFLTSWRGAHRWALVVTRPAQIPPTATLRGWIGAVLPFEKLGQPAIAEQAYAAATRRWPKQALPWLALGNARYEQGDLKGAERALARAVHVEPDDADARNNDAAVLMKLGCLAAARSQIERALSLSPDAVHSAIYRATRRQIKAAYQKMVMSPSDCPAG
jgi:ABC-type bacteriocin/lantibiotic exporters, contain an N-terminal double-glycine peptidase domain